MVARANALFVVTLAAAVAQEEALAFFEERLRNVDLDALDRRVEAFVGEAQPGQEPSPEEIDRAMGRQ